MFAFGPTELPARFYFYGYYLSQNLHWGLVMIGMMGFWFLLLRDRAAAVLLGFLYLGWMFYAIEYKIFDAHVYFIATHLVLALAIAVGVSALLPAVDDWAERFPRRWGRAISIAVCVVLILIPFVGIRTTYAKNDRSYDYRGRKTLEAVVENAAPNSTILHHRSELWYLVLVEKRRQDLTIIDPWPPGRDRYTNIVWPDDLDYITTNLRYGTNDPTGVSTAKEAAEHGPVYVLAQKSTGAHNFYDAGFTTVRVEGDLFELVLPGREPYTKQQ